MRRKERCFAALEHDCFCSADAEDSRDDRATADVVVNAYGKLTSDIETNTGGPSPSRPSIGWFLNRDPIGYGGGINLYGYAGNNPVNGVDSAGMDGTTAMQDSDTMFLAELDGTSVSQAQGFVDREHRAKAAELKGQFDRLETAITVVSFIYGAGELYVGGQAVLATAPMVLSRVAAADAVKSAVSEAVGSAAGDAITGVENGIRLKPRVVSKGSFINWSREYVEKPRIPLSKAQADELVGLARHWGVDVEGSPGNLVGHPNTEWSIPRIHFEPSGPRVHIPVVSGYTIPEP